MGKAAAALINYGYSNSSINPKNNSRINITSPSSATASVGNLANKISSAIRIGSNKTSSAKANNSTKISTALGNLSTPRASKTFKPVGNSSIEFFEKTKNIINNTKNKIDSLATNKNKSSWPTRPDGSIIINSPEDAKIYYAKTNSSKEIGGQKIYTKTTPLLDRTELETALKGSGCLKGDTSKSNIDDKLSKTSRESINKFGKGKGSWQGGVINNENTYVDTNKLTRVKFDKTFENFENDFYAVAISDMLNKDAYETIKNQNLGMTSDERFNYGGYKFQVTLKDEDGKTYNLNLISGDTKSSEDDFPGDGYFPISRDEDGNVIRDENNKPEYHDHLFEFITDGKPNSSIATGGNVDYAKLLGLSPNTRLTISDVSLYNDTPLVSGNYVGTDFETYGKNAEFGKKIQ